MKMLLIILLLLFSFPHISIADEYNITINQDSSAGGQSLNNSEVAWSAYIYADSQTDIFYWDGSQNIDGSPIVERITYDTNNDSFPSLYNGCQYPSFSTKHF